MSIKEEGLRKGRTKAETLDLPALIFNIILKDLKIKLLNNFCDGKNGAEVEY
jgi:hypothetical protein